jgi:aminobenzoyl-glutamate utilization protein B
MPRTISRPAKTSSFAFIERNRKPLATLSDSIFYFGELGMQEHRSVKLMNGLLEKEGFAITRNISGFPTGALATWGSGEPVIAMHTEYDANPSNSQRSGVAERSEIVSGAPGHCEGHNLNAAVMVTAAMAVKRAMQEHKLSGTLKVFSAPAEEQLISRPYFVRDGFFEDVDVAFHQHILDEFRTDYGLMQIALVSAEFTFTGETAHAATTPWKGRDALDALVLMDVGMAQFREHFEPGMSAHRVFTHAGEQPNVIPPRASGWWYFRHRSAEGAQRLYDQACKIAQGAALMANCELAIDIRAGVWPGRGNRTLAETIQGNIESVGMPDWTEEEQNFARSLQRAAKVREDGLRTHATPLTGPAEQMAASNDSGDISWVVPMARLWFPSNVPNVAFHHWAGGAALTTSIAHKGAEAGAKALAASVLDFMIEPSLVTEAQRTFQQEIAGVEYRSLLPPNQRVAVDTNRELMDRYRPLMERHYLKEEPVFT